MTRESFPDALRSASLTNEVSSRWGGLEGAELATCLGKLVSLLALPSLCQGRSSQEIPALALDALAPLLDFELACLRLAAPDHRETLRYRGAGTAPADELLESFALPHLVVPPPPPGHRVVPPWGGEALGLLVVPLGFYGENGMLLLASKRADFPRPVEAIVARTAASLVASASENALAREGLEQARRELEEASRAKDEFLAMLGHELRNPLAPIVTALELMKRRGGAPPRECAIIERQVEHLRRLVDDLLDVSRMTRGKVELQKQRVDLAEIVARSIGVASPLVEARKHELVVDCDPQGVPVDVDVVRLVQVVSNLLTNAAKYTEPGGRIEVRAWSEGTEACVAVRDSGTGISPEMLPRVFELFAQEQRSIHRSEGGLGLGLAIVKNLVTAHGGRVEARSEGLGRGSEFLVRLPLASGARAEAVAASQPTPEMHATGSVLVVDDNEDAGDLLADFVRQLGYRVQVARDGGEGLRLAEATLPDAVLLDIGLPVLDGYEVAGRIRANAALRATRLVAISGYGQASDRLRTQAAGFDAHLTKPVDPAAVGALLLRLLPASPA